ncbi:MAG: hypothetical protein WBW14_31440, partial [Candidatus Acidiferrum sp.]
DLKLPFTLCFLHPSASRMSCRQFRQAMWRSVGIEFPKCPATSATVKGKVLDDEGIGKKNFRRCGISIQEISAQQVIPMIQ